MPNTGSKTRKTKVTCSSCQTENPAESRFCHNCAAPLKTGTAAPAPLPSGTKTILLSTAELVRGQKIDGRYEIIETLGQGGMGTVFRVFDGELHETVALKLIRPEISVQEKAIERFKNELKFARKITHRNICRMHDLGEFGQLFYITMEYVAGEDLKRFIKRAGPLNIGRALAIAKQVTSGLAEAHRVGAIHRDLKPQNIMIDRDGNAKIMDFGIARFVDMDRVTGTGVMIGTPEYMAPEQAELKDIDARADLYALGVVLFEMLTGRVPFEGDTAFSLAMKHKTEKPRDIRELNPLLPAGLAELVARCLEKDPASRYQSADELMEALSAVEAESATGEMPAPRPGTTRTARPGTATATAPAAAAKPGTAVAPAPVPKTATLEKPGLAAAAARGATKRLPLLLGIGIIVVAAAVAAYVLLRPKEIDSAASQTFGNALQAPDVKKPLPAEKNPDAVSADTQAFKRARSLVRNVKSMASQSGLNDNDPFFREARGYEAEASTLAEAGNPRDAQCALTVAEAIYRTCVERSDPEDRLSAMKAVVAKSRAAAEDALFANPNDPRFGQVFAVEREAEAARIKKNVEASAKSFARAAYLYEVIAAEFKAGKKTPGAASASIPRAEELDHLGDRPPADGAELARRA